MCSRYRRSELATVGTDGNRSARSRNTRHLCNLPRRLRHRINRILRQLVIRFEVARRRKVNLRAVLGPFELIFGELPLVICVGFPSSVGVDGTPIFQMCGGRDKSKYPSLSPRYSTRVTTWMSGSCLGLPHFSAIFSFASFSFLLSTFWASSLFVTFASAGLLAAEAGSRPCFSSHAARSISSGFAVLKNAIVLPSGDHSGPPAPCGILVNGHASPPVTGRMKICGGCGLPSFSTARMNARSFPSGDQRGD